MNSAINVNCTKKKVKNSYLSITAFPMQKRDGPGKQHTFFFFSQAAATIF
jgi:hypothetical protein